MRQEKDVTETSISFIFEKDSPKNRVWLPTGDTSGHLDLQGKLDFSQTYSKVGAFPMIENCLPLAVQEKNPKMSTDDVGQHRSRDCVGGRSGVNV